MQIDTWNRAEMNISQDATVTLVAGGLPVAAQSPPVAGHLIQSFSYRFSVQVLLQWPRDSVLHF